MATFTRHIFLLLCSFCFCCTLFGKGSISPKQQKSSINSLQKAPFYPKVSPQSLPKGALLFSAYITKDDYEMVKEEALAWNVSLPRSPVYPHINRKKGRSLLFSVLFPAVNKHIHMQVREKERKRALDEVHHLHQVIASQALDESLQNSLEFKVKSQTEIEDFSPTLVKEAAKAIAKDTICIAKKELVRTSSSYIADASFSLLELAPEASKEEIKASKEERVEIERDPQFIPTILAPEASIEQNFSPLIASISPAVAHSQVDNTKLRLNHVVSVLPKVLQDSFSMANVSISRSDPHHYTKQTAEIVVDHTLPNVVTKMHTAKIEETPSLSFENSIPLKEQMGEGDSVVQKYSFVEDTLYAKLPASPFKTTQITRNTSFTTSGFHIEKQPYFRHTTTRAVLPEIALNYHSKHQFTTTHYRNRASEMQFFKRLPSTQIERSSIIFSPIGELPNSIYSEQFHVASMEKPIHEIVVGKPAEELVAKSRKEDYGKTASKENKTLAKIENAPLTDDYDFFSYERAEIGRLAKHFEQSEEEFYVGKLKTLLDADTPSTFTIAEYTKHPFEGDYAIEQIANREEFEQIKPLGLNSSIVPKSYSASYPLRAQYSTISYKEEVSYDTIMKETKKLLDPEEVTTNIALEDMPLVYSDIPSKTSLQGMDITFERYNLSLEDHIAFADKAAIPDVTTREVKTYKDVKPSFLFSESFSLLDDSMLEAREKMQHAAYEINKNLRMVQYSLYNWPTLEELNTESLPSEFFVDTRILSSNEDDIDFAISLKATDSGIIGTLPTHILYVLDTSNSIESHRFHMFKEAIIQSLTYLDSSVRFNVAILKKGKVDMLLSKSARSTKSSASYVKRKLRKVEQEGKTRLSDMIGLLEKEKLKGKKGSVHRNCVLLTDGNFAKNIRVDREYLQRLATIDTGNFSVYTATVSDKNNKEMLSLLSKLNHGFSLFTRTHASFARKFSVMVKHIKNPIIHDLKITFPDNPEMMAYISDCISPTVLSDKTVTLFGNTNAKSPSRIFIQGRSGDKWINILKELPLDSSRKGRYTLHKKLAHQKTLFSLFSFLESRDEKYLSDAKKHTDEYNLPSLVP